MSFRLRLALFLLAILMAVQALTWAAVYEVTRRQSIAEGERQLAAAADAFVNQLDDIAERASNSVQVLALDYPLREAIAGQDRETLLSALRNHGRRVGAERMLLVDLEGRIVADTRDDRGADAAPAAFPFPGLLDRAIDRPVRAAVAMDGGAYWMIVVTVSAPEPLAMIAAAIPIDDRLLARMQRLSPLSKNIELLAAPAAQPWRVVAHGDPHLPLAQALQARAPGLPATPVLVEVQEREFVALARPIEGAADKVRMTAVFGYSLDQALGPFRAVTRTWLLLALLALAAGVLGALLIAGGVSRPLEALAGAAARFAAGDYAPLPAAKRQDELGRVATAFDRMGEAIREREARIRFQAEHDGATDLSNRVAAEAAIERDLPTRARDSGALLMIGLARLPEIVKTMGHALSDRLMRDAGQRLQALAGGQLVARAADHQFLLWLPAAQRGDAVTLAFRAHDALGQPYREEDLAIDAAPAIGIALHPEHGDRASALLQHADVALFEALRREEPMAIYDPAADPHRPERLALMGELRAAIDGDALEIHYQPRLNLATGRIDGAEGLVRWTHPQRGPIAPDEFVPLAERTGNVRRLTCWILANGVAQTRRWLDAGHDLRIALNLSARDLDDAALPKRVDELLSAHRLPVDRLVLEITESAVMGEPESAIAVLRRLADLGVGIALDDFGVGQSSLAYLRRLPVHELKVDRSFVRRLGEDAEDQAIVHSIVDLGHRLGCRVTCEGVEDRAALESLVRTGCDHAQGYYISRPLPVAQLSGFASAYAPALAAG